MKKEDKVHWNEPWNPKLWPKKSPKGKKERKDLKGRRACRKNRPILRKEGVSSNEGIKSNEGEKEKGFRKRAVTVLLYVYLSKVGEDCELEHGQKD